MEHLLVPTRPAWSVDDLYAALPAALAQIAAKEARKEALSLTKAARARAAARLAASEDRIAWAEVWSSPLLEPKAEHSTDFPLCEVPPRPRRTRRRERVRTRDKIKRGVCALVQAVREAQDYLAL